MSLRTASSVIDSLPERLTIIVPVQLQVIRRALAAFGEIVDTATGAVDESVFTEMLQPVLDVLLGVGSFGCVEEHTRCCSPLFKQREDFLISNEDRGSLGYHLYLYL